MPEVLNDYYVKRYGKPKDDDEAVQMLCKIFKELMGYNFLTQEVQDGIAEYYKILKTRELPAFEWMIEAFHAASRKSPEKRNFPYVIGMLRTWMKYGFGHVPSQEEEDVIDYLEEVIRQPVSPDARHIIQHLMGTYGAIKVTRMIAALDKGDIDISKVVAETIKEALQNKYGIPDTDKE